MSNVANYQNYKNNEYQYIKYPIQRESFLMLSLLINQIDISTPLEGKVFSIYLPNFEIIVERLIKLPLCTVCGQVSVTKSNDYNIATKNAIDEVLKSGVWK